MPYLHLPYYFKPEEIKEIKTLNNLSGDMIYTGQTLKAQK